MGKIDTSAALLNTAALGELLGLDRRTLYTWRASGQLGPKPVTAHGHPRWSRAEVRAWLDNRDAAGQLHGERTWPAVWSAVRKRYESAA